MSTLSLDSLDPQQVIDDSDLFEDVIETPVGKAIMVSTAGTVISDVALLLATERPDFLRPFLQWAKASYPALHLDIDRDMARVMEEFRSRSHG